MKPGHCSRYRRDSVSRRRRRWKISSSGEHWAMLLLDTNVGRGGVARQRARPLHQVVQGRRRDQVGDLHGQRDHRVPAHLLLAARRAEQVGPAGEMRLVDVDKRASPGQGGGRGPAPEAGHHQRHQDHRCGWQGQEQTQLETARRREHLDYHVNVMLWILFSFKTWIITVLFSPVSGSSMDTVALIDLSNSSLITSSSRRASSRFSSSLASFSRFSFVKTLSIVSILESFFRPKISVLFFREASIKSWVQLLSEGAMLV